MVTSQHDAAAAPPRRRHALRNTGVGVLGVLLALIVVGGVCEIVEWPFLRQPLEHKLSQLLDRPVAFGDHFGVRLLGSVRGHADSLTIGPAANGGPTLVDESGKPRDFMNAKSVRLGLSYGALWRQYRGTGEPLQVKLLDVDGLELNLKRNADGLANWQFGAARPAPAASAPQLPRFERLNVRNGEVRIEDVPLRINADAQVSTHEGSALPAAPAASGAAAPGLRIAAGTAASATAASAAAIDDDTPGLRIDGKGSYRDAPLVLRLRSSGLLPLASADAGAPAVPLWLDVHAGKTRIRLDGRATDLLHFGGMDATFRASGPSLAAVGDALGVTLPTTAAFTTNGRLQKHGALWEADFAAMDIGSSRLRGDFRFDTVPDVPKLTGTLHGRRLALVDLGPAFGAATPDTPTVKKSDRVLPEREFDIPSLRAMNADVGIDLDTADLGTDKLEPFKPLQGRIGLQDGVLTLHDLVARTSAGAVLGTLVLDSRPALPKWNADLHWTGIQLERFIKARDVATKKDAAGKRPDTGYVSGALGGNAKLTGEGRSTAKLLASLDGTARLWVRDGKVSHVLVEAAGIDVAQALGVYIKGDDQMPMQCAVAQLRLVNGKVTPEVGLVDTLDTTIVVGGELSLASETLALKMTAHPHDFSPLALRTPVKVVGTFADPHVRPEARQLALRAGAAAALSLASPLAALLALVDFRQPERDVCTAAVAHVDGAARAGVKSGPADGSASARPAKTPVRPAKTPVSGTPDARATH